MKCSERERERERGGERVCVCVRVCVRVRKVTWKRNGILGVGLQMCVI